MAINGAKTIIPVINKIRQEKQFDLTILCRDWHPKDHVSFASNNPGTEVFGMKLIEETGIEQTMWPDHCIQDTHGAKYH